MNKKYTVTGTFGRTTPWAAIGLGLMGVGLLTLIVTAVAIVIANRPQSPTPTPDAEGTARAATAKAAPTLTAEAQAATRAIAEATAQAAARATANALSTARANEVATAQAHAEATRVQAQGETATAEAAPIVTALARTTAIAGAIVTFEDNFDSNTHGWDLDESPDEYADSSTSIVDGQFIMSMTSKQSVIWWENVPDLLAQDFFLSVEATVVETSAASGDAGISLIFREDEKGNRYRVRFDSDGSYKVYLWLDGEWITLQDWESHEAIQLEQGVTNTFAILARGEELTVYVNGHELTTVSDATLSQAGEIGLALGLSEADQSLTVAFDNLVVKEAPAGKTSAEIQATATARARAAATADVASTATALARATVMAGAVVLFEDGFDSNENGWDVADDSDEYAESVAQISDGKYTRSITSKRDVFWWESIPGLSAQDFFFSVEVTLVETSAEPGDADVSLSFREDEDGNLYRVPFDNAGNYKVFLRRDGEWETLSSWRFNEAIRLEEGVTNIFAILVRGTEFTIYANGQELATVSDATLTQAGEISLGLGLYEGDQTLTVEFDNLVVKEIP